MLALREHTGASLLVGHSYGGLIALEVARNNPAFTKIGVYEPGVSIDGSMPVDWIPGYTKKLGANKRIEAFVDFILADAPPRIRRTPPWLMTLMVRVLVRSSKQYRQMLNLLPENLREWREIARLDNTYENYREITADVLLMYGQKSDSVAVDRVAERLPAVISRLETREFADLDHFGIERTAPGMVAETVSTFFMR